MPSVEQAVTAPTRRRARHTLGVLVAALSALLLLGAACTDDDDNGDDSGDESSQPTPTADPEDPAADVGEGEPGGDGDGEAPDFASTVGAAQAALEAAQDPCEVADALTEVQATSSPQSSEEIAVAVSYYAALLNAMADTSSDPQVAEELRAGAAGFEEFASGVGNDLEALDLEGDGPDYPEAESTQAAVDQWMGNELTACFSPDDLTDPPS